MNKTFKSPCRVDISGGTLDIWPLYSILDVDCYTINFAIDIFTSVTLTSNSNKFSIEIQNKTLEFESIESFLMLDDIRVKIFQKVIEYFKPKDFFRLKINSDSPIGGGLGASSSLLVSMIECMEELTEKYFDIYNKIEFSKNIESHILQKPTGTQDYFAPILKNGFFIISYTKEGITFERIKIPKIIKDMLLVYTGVSHNSGLNNWSLIKKVMDGCEDTKKNLEELAEVSKDLNLVLKKQSSSDFFDLLKKEFDLRIKLSEDFSSKEILEIKNIVDDYRDSAVKICGAGGGGCVCIFSPHIEEIKKRLNFKILNAKPIDLIG